MLGSYIILPNFRPINYVTQTIIDGTENLKRINNDISKKQF